MSDTRRKPRPNFWLYLVFVLVTLGLLVWSTVRLLRETPARELAVDMPGRGTITLRLTTDPFPPLPSGTVKVNLMASNSRGVTIDLGPSLNYNLLTKADESFIMGGEAIPGPGGAGYEAGVQFPTPGDYWLIFELGNGRQARFQVYVEPAQ